MGSIELLIATANQGKAREFREMLGDGSGGASWNFQFVELSSLGVAPHVEETGKTFLQNACIKASAYAKHFKRWALADDSGLEIDALNKSPGVYSARWAEMNGARTGAGKGDRDNNRLVLQQLEDVPEEKRTARFVCVLALSDEQGRIILTTRGQVEGRILQAERGTNGFGYDPLFFIDSLGKTTAELSPDEKHNISHRGIALRAMKELLRRIV